ncbi:MAG: response regulator transcription factor [Oscillospiraceae bacterium]|nr:response regulator transcription factor [Oscillospiraceae bacterium]
MIFLLEDDESIRKLVVYALESSGFEARGFERPSLFWKAINEECPELVLLDIMLPEEDGLSVLKKLRSVAMTRDIPVIMLTARNTEYDKVIGLDNGADDFVTKPFGMLELVARVKALLRRSVKDSKSTAYTFDRLCVYPDKRSVSVDGKNVELTYKEFELLCALLEHPGRVMTRDAIMDRVWGSEFDGENRTVDVHIRTLRSKLGAAGDCVKTVRGVGYKIGE